MGMILSHNFSVVLTLYNRKYAKNTLQPKPLSITLRAATEESFSAATLKDRGAELTTLLNKAALVSVNDPILIRMIEPKAGNTVHTFLESAKQKLTANEYMAVGFTVPPETVNGYHVIILGAAIEVTMEGIAAWLLDFCSDVGVTTVILDDGSLHAEVSV